MNCEKNAVVCEGYHEKQLWKSGKERTDGMPLHYTAALVAGPPILTEDRACQDGEF